MRQVGGIQIPAEALAAEGKPALFVSIEQLADLASTPPWTRGSASVCGVEARARKPATSSSTRSTRRVSTVRISTQRYGGWRGNWADSLGRAHLFISCRVSDWRGQQDRDAVLQCLPVPGTGGSRAEPIEPDRALLDPSLRKGEKARAHRERRYDNQLLVVQLVPLDKAQRRALTLAARINDTDAFMAAIDQHGLETLAERPGDLLDLIEYWRNTANSARWRP